jgi:hypothetical protein
LLALGCSGDGAGSPDASPGAATTVVQLPLEAGDTRLLQARGNLIENITLSGQKTTVVELEKNVRILQLALSPDASQIAFVVELPAHTDENGQLDFGADLYVSNFDGSGLRLLAPHESVGDYFEAPAWLDGSTLLVGWRGFDAKGSTNRIERVDVADGTREVLLQDAAMGALSPDRHAIAYGSIDPQTRIQRLVIEDLTSNDKARVLVDESDGLALFSAVAFSPDGAQVAFAAVDLLQTAAPPPRPPAAAARGGFQAAPGISLHPFAQDIWVVHPTGAGGLRRLAEVAENMPSLSWSGDGANLYVFGPGFLWRLDPATGFAEQLRDSGGPGAIVWLDGR